MELAINIQSIKIIQEKPAKSRPFQYLNEFYKAQGLQFDEYGNPVYLEDSQEPEEEEISNPV